ncbi:B3 domain-containing protein REM17-like isoform X3 [Malania oleifera]|uniref:B3 domain-containing protein REM17-like isoform X3 n=1 Tax=Malania oleifera TaxID=397392 RepID=UPI0025ADEFB8|nr:B3 domain-containing protein REM17-like isoform X3 [Malania oleifera]
MECSRMPSTNPHFFMPILPGSNKELLIPSSFMIKYLLDDPHGEHCKQAVLRSSSIGKHWPVKLNGRRLEDGWPEFARDHNLQVGDFLVFRHEGNLVFHIMIFDATACERKYRSCDHHHVKLEDDDQRQEKNESFKPGPLKDFRDVLKKKPEHPCFWGTVPFCKDHRMSIPSYFARANGLSGKMILIGEKGKPWPVDIWHRKSDGLVCISRGWSAFRVANGLKRGDVLIFELIEKGAMPITNVHEVISRKCLYPYFVEAMKPYNIKKSYLTIPKKFVIANDLSHKNCEIILRDQQARSWPATLIHRNKGLVCIENDWSKFTVANDIEVGDIFVVELVKEGTKLVLNFFSWKEFFAQSLEKIWVELEKRYEDTQDKETLLQKCHTQIIRMW